MQYQQPNLEWRAGDVPVSMRFDDPYFSLDNGLAETRHVFLEGNDLPARFCDGFHIAELGFGTGLNLLATLDAWRTSKQGGVLHYTTFEAYPMARAEIHRAQSAFPQLAALSAEIAPYMGQTRFNLPDLRFEMRVGDARQTLPQWQGTADAWFLDGFSPAKNPELWEQDLMIAVCAHTSNHGTAATYTAAGFVRRRLEAAGFDVSREPGYGRKRHMTQARKSNR